MEGFVLSSPLLLKPACWITKKPFLTCGQKPKASEGCWVKVKTSRRLFPHSFFNHINQNESRETAEGAGRMFFCTCSARTRRPLKMSIYKKAIWVSDSHSGYLMRHWTPPRWQENIILCCSAHFSLGAAENSLTVRGLMESVVCVCVCVCVCVTMWMIFLYFWFSRLKQPFYFDIKRKLFFLFTNSSKLVVNNKHSIFFILSNLPNKHVSHPRMFLRNPKTMQIINNKSLNISQITNIFI